MLYQIYLNNQINKKQKKNNKLKKNKMIIYNNLKKKINSLNKLNNNEILFPFHCLNLVTNYLNTENIKNKGLYKIIKQ